MSEPRDGTRPGIEELPPTRRARPRSLSARVAVTIAATFLVLWVVFAVRAVDRNADPIAGPTPPDLSATLDATGQGTLPTMPDRSYPIDGGDGASPPASPVGTPASPVATPLATPIGSPVGSPAP